MNRLLFFCGMVACAVSLFAQTVRLDTMKVGERNDYLTKLAKEVTLAFGPGYYRDSVIPIVSEIEVFHSEDNIYTEINACSGRRYYTVTFPTNERLIRNYTSKVLIWEDDGQPLSVHFGGCELGRNFIIKSYKQWLEQGIKESDQFPYRTRPIIDNPFKQ